MSGPTEDLHRRKQRWTSAIPQYEEAHRKSQPDRQVQAQESLEPQSDSAIYVGAEPYVTRDVAGPPSGAVEDFDPTSIDFQAETYAGIGLSDYRYMAPIGPGTKTEDVVSVDRALMLTRMDFCQLVGQYPPYDPTGEIQFESYVSQYRRLQQAFSKMWDGQQPVPALYCLPAWGVGFGWWEASDPRGQELLAAIEDVGW
ncbi:hypothetical protein MMC28_004899 [Mycoblastus sanguinarius]|nr:hypothetical protein [Mycoblastus sanguinarius]